MRGHRGLLACSILVLGFLALAIHELPRYGPTFDAVLGDYAYGEHLWRYVATGDPAWLRFDRAALDFLGKGDHPDWLQTYPLKFVYPLPAMLSAAACDLFARRLHWLHPIDAHHLVCPLAAAALLWMLFGFVARRAGVLAATCALLALALHPRFLGEAMNNIKDAPTLAIVFAGFRAFAAALETRRVRWVLLGGVLTGIGLAFKINAAWPAAFFAIVALATRAGALARGDREAWRFVGAGVLALALAAAAYVAVSIQFRVDGAARFAEHARYALVDSTRVEGRDFFSLEPPATLALVTPLAWFLLVPLGLIAAVREPRMRGDVLALLLLLMIVPVLRPCLPGMRYFNGVRHFLEVIVAGAIFAGAGAAALARAARPLLGRAAAVTAALLVVVPQGLAVAATHPYESTYYNALAGGLRGAQRDQRRDANDYWCHSCREAVRWLNEHADRGALVLEPVTPWMIGSLARTELRPDLKFVESPEALQLLLDKGLLDDRRDAATWAPAPVVWIVYRPLTLRYNRHPDDRVMRFCEDRLAPAATIERDGGTIVAFYRIETTAR